jgi:antitoxin (DNA-binding transcriptional repressor) of toxin-antitoxin stability system
LALRALPIALGIRNGILGYMSTVRVEEQSREIAALVLQAKQGEEIVFTVEHLPVARLVPVNDGGVRPQPQFGSFREKIRLSPDFDAPLEDFREYMK